MVDTVCKERNAGTYDEYNQQKKDAGVDRKEAQKAKEKATEDFQKQQSDLLKTQNDAATEMVKLRQDYRDKKQKLTEENEDKVKEIKDKKLAAVKAAQESLDKINTAYISLRAELREAADKISTTDLNWKVDCRSKALANSKDVQKAMDARMAQEDASVNSINNQSNGIFGLRYRRLNKKRQKIADEYNETLTRCLKGEVDPGALAKKSVEDMRLQLASKQKKADDLDAQMKSQSAAIQTQLTQLQNDNDTEIQKYATRLQENLKNADDDFNSNLQLLQQKQAAAQQAAQQQQATNLKQLKQSDTDVQTAAREQALASNLANCSSRNKGKVNQADAKKSGREGAIAKAAEGRAACKTRKNLQNCEDDLELNKLCNVLDVKQTSAAEVPSTSSTGGAADAAQ